MGVTWGFLKFKADAEKVYHEIESLGECGPERIVEYAKDDSTELHKCFEWDDTKAAERWRVQQARMVCNSLTVTIEVEEAEPISVRIIEHDDTEKVYRPIVATVRNEDQYSRLLSQAKSELASFKRRFQSIKELRAIIDDIEEVLNR